jgi:hypothetical protein
LLSGLTAWLTLASLLVLSAATGTRGQSHANTAAAGKPQQARGTIQGPRPNPIFDEILPELKRKTHVPLRLPSYVPFSERIPEDELNKNVGEENLYASIDEISEERYAVQLAFGRDCAGAHVCRDGGITGATAYRDEHPNRKKVPVKLRAGIHGFFVDAECGAYCDESVLYWAEGGYHYSVSSKAAKKEQLIKIANSAIEVAQAVAARWAEADDAREHDIK